MCRYFSAEYLGADLRPGEVTELQISKQFPLVNPAGLVCLTLKLKQKLKVDNEALWSIPPVVLKVEPENTRAVVVPLTTGFGSRWVQVKVSLSRLNTPFRIVFLQTGPTNVLGTSSNSNAVSLELGLEELRLSPISC